MSSVQSANLANLQIGQVGSRFANCAAQYSRYSEIYLICNFCQPISFHNMTVSIVGRQESETLTIVISVNIFHTSK